MFYEEYLETWYGFKVEDFQIEGPRDYKKNIYRMATGWVDERDEVVVQLDALFADPKCGECQGLIIGLNSVEEGSAHRFYEVTNKLVENKDRLPNLKYLFLGEMNSEDSELSWIGQSDVGALVLEAFPGLVELRARGGVDHGEGILKFSACRHIGLEKLVLQAVGLHPDNFEGLSNAVLPELKSLELWAATDYGFDKLAALILANPFSKLEHLAIKNSCVVSRIVPIIAKSGMANQIKSLDFSLSNFNDKGAKDLLNCEFAQNLSHLTVHHHFVSEAMEAKLHALNAKVEMSCRQSRHEGDPNDESYGYAAVSE